MNGCAVAVWDAGGDEAVSAVEPMLCGHAERLVPLAQNILTEAHLDFSDIDLIATTVGPGAFTGLRIGLSAARAMGLALDVPVVGVTTLDVLAASYLARHQDPHNLLVLIETKRSDFYGQLFSPAGDILSEPFALPAEQISALYLVDSIVLIGDASQRFLSLLLQEQKAGVVVRTGFEVPDPAHLARLAYRQYASGGYLTPPKPLYLREADISQSRKTQRKIAE